MTLEEVVQTSYRAFNERDVATLRELYTDDCLWDGRHFPGFPGRTQYVGPQGIVEFIDDWWSAWEAFEVTPKEVVPAPNGVFIRGLLRGRARGGLELEIDMGQLAHIAEDGRIAAVYNYADVSEARRDAGL